MDGSFALGPAERKGLMAVFRTHPDPEVRRRAFLMTPDPPPPIPAVSAWGALLMALALLTSATVVLGRGRPRESRG